MEGEPKNIESVKNEITTWFDQTKEKLVKSFPNMSEGDLVALKNALSGIDTEYDRFNDFISKKS